MTTALYLLRCVQLGLSVADLDLLEIGMIWDIFTENTDDDLKWPYKATQADFDKF